MSVRNYGVTILSSLKTKEIVSFNWLLVAVVVLVTKARDRIRNQDNNADSHGSSDGGSLQFQCIVCRAPRYYAAYLIETHDSTTH